jgi:ribosomal protein S18 acetylase RimI-like enzyme
VRDWLIRRAANDDEPFLFEMVYEALFVAPGADPFPRAVLGEPQIAHYAKDFGRPGDYGLVAETSAGLPMGAAWVRRFSRNDPGYGYVDDETPELSIAVIEKSRGTGVGTALLVQLLVEVPRCSLSVDHRNPAVRLYERLGFEMINRSGDSLTMLRRQLTVEPMANWK